MNFFAKNDKIIVINNKGVVPLRRIICLLLSFCTLLISSLSVGLALDNDEKLPSGVAVVELEGKIDEYVSAHKTATAAMSVAVFNKNEIFTQKYYGYSDIENNAENDMGTVMEWGSCSKLLIWISVMQLVELGKIDLDANIFAYLPSHFLTKLKYDDAITMRNLMHHNAGWQDVISDIMIKPENALDYHYNLEQALRETEPEQIYRPGEVTAYSNWGAALAAYIVECVTKTDFSQYVYNHIFKRLGMDETSLSVDLVDNMWVEERRHRLKCYEEVDGENLPLGESFYYIPLYPAGMCTGTLTDFIKFAQALIPQEGAKTRLFKYSSSLKKLFTVTDFMEDKTLPRFAYGMMVMNYGKTVYGHSGNTSGCSSTLLIEPESGIGAVVMTNQSQEIYYNRLMLQDLVFGKYNTDKSESISDTLKEGYYLNLRTCVEGPLKLYNLFNFMKIEQTGDYTYSDIKSDYTFKQISEHNLITNEGVVVHYFNDGEKDILQMPVSDCVKVSTFYVFASYGLLVLFFALGIYGAGVLTMFVIGTIKSKKTSIFEVVRTVCSLAMLIVPLNTVFCFVRLVDYDMNMGQLRTAAIINFVSMIFILLSVIITGIFFKKLPRRKHGRKAFITTALCGLCMVLIMLYFDLYIFW